MILRSLGAYSEQYEIEIDMKKSERKIATQGSEKLSRYMEALWYNKKFQKRYYPIKLMPSGEKRSQAMIKLAKEYHLTYAMLDSFLHPLGDDEQHREYKTPATVDMVAAINNKSEKEDVEETIFMNAHPVSLTISKIASKNDVLDFVEKKWKTDIEPLLRSQEPHPPILKPRETMLRDFMLLNFTEGDIVKTRKFVGGIFPEVLKMKDHEIYSLMSKEKRRRPEKQNPTATGGH